MCHNSTRTNLCMTHVHGTWGKNLGGNRRVILKEVGRLDYLYSTIPEVSNPAAEVSFILDAYH